MNSGISELDTLLATMDAELQPGKYVFFTTDSPVTAPFILSMEPVGFFREKEGMSFIIELQAADRHGIAYESVYRLISLQVHSSLNAVGLTAAVAKKLAAENISANVVAAYYHDHIFVPAEKADRALDAIRELQSRYAPTEPE